MKEENCFTTSLNINNWPRLTQSVPWSSLSRLLNTCTRITSVIGTIFRLASLFTNFSNLRDIKPENFLLKKENDISSIKLIDFGLSKILDNKELMNTPNGTVRHFWSNLIAILYCSRSSEGWIFPSLWQLVNGSCPLHSPYWTPTIPRKIQYWNPEECRKGRIQHEAPYFWQNFRPSNYLL